MSTFFPAALTVYWCKYLVTRDRVSLSFYCFIKQYGIHVCTYICTCHIDLGIGTKTLQVIASISIKLKIVSKGVALIAW